MSHKKNESLTWVTHNWLVPKLINCKLHWSPTAPYPHPNTHARAQVLSVSSCQCVGWIFSACEWQDLSFIFPKSGKTTYLLSSLRSLRDCWNPTGVVRHLESWLGSLWQNSPRKDAFFCISLANIHQCFNSNAHLKSNGAPIYPINDTETAIAKFQKVLFSWATKPEDCF